MFVDFGIGRNGFLHVSDVEYQYYKHLVRNAKSPSRARERSMSAACASSAIQEIFQRGSEVLVQVIKEGFGTKGPTLSTYISIPGRYLVLMPGLQRLGVQPQDRRRRCPPPPAPLAAGHHSTRRPGLHRPHRRCRPLGGRSAPRHELPVAAVEDAGPSPRKGAGPGVIYEESDMITRTIRDIYTADIESIWIDQPDALERARDFMEVVLPKHVERIKHYEGREPIFGQYKIEEEISAFKAAEFRSPRGARSSSTRTEALVAIDVNSGNFRNSDSMPRRTPTRSTWPQLRKSPARSGSAIWVE